MSVRKKMYVHTQQALKSKFFLTFLNPLKSTKKVKNFKFVLDTFLYKFWRARDVLATPLFMSLILHF
jgi:hypothetical protein